MEFWRTKGFKKLQLVWNEKLKESGFKEELENIASTSYGKASPLERETRLEYYLKVEECFNKTIFDDPAECIIMGLHAQGCDSREIGVKLLEAGISRHKRTILYTIKRYQMKWGIRSWTPKQMKKVAIK